MGAPGAQAAASARAQVQSSLSDLGPGEELTPGEAQARGPSPARPAAAPSAPGRARGRVRTHDTWHARAFLVSRQGNAGWRGAGPPNQQAGMRQPCIQAAPPGRLLQEPAGPPCVPGKLQGGRRGKGPPSQHTGHQGGELLHCSLRRAGEAEQQRPPDAGQPGEGGGAKASLAVRSQDVCAKNRNKTPRSQRQPRSVIRTVVSSTSPPPGPGERAAGPLGSGSVHGCGHGQTQRPPGRGRCHWGRERRARSFPAGAGWLERRAEGLEAAAPPSHQRPPSSLCLSGTDLRIFQRSPHTPPMSSEVTPKSSRPSVLGGHVGGLPLQSPS